MPKPHRHVFVCSQQRAQDHPRGSCAATGAYAVSQAFANLLTAKNLQTTIGFTQTGCLGPCHLGTNVLVYPDGILYSNIQPSDVENIIDQHLIKGKPVTDKIAPTEIW